MAETELKLPLIDLSGYIDPKEPGDRERVIAEVKDACAKFGFFQTKGHGISKGLQKGLLDSINTLFDMPKEEKRKLSFLKNVSRRGYEESGMSLRDGDKLPDSKEVCPQNLSSIRTFYYFLAFCAKTVRHTTSDAKTPRSNTKASMDPTFGHLFPKTNFEILCGIITMRLISSALLSGRFFFKGSAILSL